MNAVVARLWVNDHPTRPDYQVSRVAGHLVVTGRHYEDGQLGVYIDAGCLVPEVLLREMDLWNDAQGKGRLAGNRGDRVKAKDMGGVLSDGVFYGRRWFDYDGVWHTSDRWEAHWREGDDVAADLGVLPPAATKCPRHSLGVSPSLCGRVRVYETDGVARAEVVEARLQGRFPGNRFAVRGDQPRMLGGRWWVEALYEPGVAQDIVDICREARAAGG